MRIFRSTCYLCGRDLEPIEPVNRACQFHPVAVPYDCTVEFTDAWGIAVDLDAEREAAGIEDGAFQFLKPNDGTEIEVPSQRFKFADQALGEVFEDAGVPRLGGASTGKGWTSYSIYQRCPYAWKRRYIDGQERRDSITESLGIEPESRAIGALVHAFLALYYTGMMPGSPYVKLTPEAVYDRVMQLANPKYVAEAWRVFECYRLFYKFETIEPLAVEHDVRDPRTGESCRYDLVAFFPNEAPGFTPGTYAVEHKTAGRFDDATLDGWANDGECLGEVGLWKKLGLDHRFGPLKGLIVNILGKQKEPKFHRTIVAPSSMQLAGHFRDLERTDAQIALARSTDVFPRYRGNCIGRWGKCDSWYHCVTTDDYK